MDTEDEYILSSSDSSTDEEWQERLEETKRAQERDKAHDALWELFRKNNIDSKLNGLINNDVIEQWLRAQTCMDDILRGNRLKKEHSTVLSYEITNHRILEFRDVAKATARLYRPEFAKFKSYIDAVCASMIKYHYRL